MYIPKKKWKFFNSKDFKNFIQWKKNGNVSFTENSIYWLILVTKLIRIDNFPILKILIIFNKKQ